MPEPGHYQIKDEEELIRRVTERVWELWRAALRQERERRGALRTTVPSRTNRSRDRRR